MQLKRRQFIKTAGAGLAYFAGGAKAESSILPDDYKDSERKMIFGWTTCLTYETGDRQQGFEYFSRLLDEMKAHGMSSLIVMMASHGYFSPKNHGIAWPVKNPKLKPQLDKKALNAVEETEFFSKVIEKAHRLGIDVYIEIKYLGMIGVIEGYPGIEFSTTSDGTYVLSIRPEASQYEKEAIESLQICCDSDQAHAYMRDKIRDVLERYNNLDGILLEHPSYNSHNCYCQSTQEKIFQTTGKHISEISEAEFVNWKNIRIRDTLIDLKHLIKSINSQFSYGFYTGFSPSNGDVAEFQRNRGHSIETLKQVGFDFVMPYCEGRHGDNETKEIEKVTEYLAPLKVYLHTTIRRKPPHNYPLPPKGPQYVKEMIHWGKGYFQKNERFLGMSFFNEVKIPQENRQAVYESI